MHTHAIGELIGWSVWGLGVGGWGLKERSVTPFSFIYRAPLPPPPFSLAILATTAFSTLDDFSPRRRSNGTTARWIKSSNFLNIVRHRPLANPKECPSLSFLIRLRVLEKDGLGVVTRFSHPLLSFTNTCVLMGKDRKGQFLGSASDIDTSQIEIELFKCATSIALFCHCNKGHVFSWILTGNFITSVLHNF